MSAEYTLKITFFILSKCSAQIDPQLTVHGSVWQHFWARNFVLLCTDLTTMEEKNTWHVQYLR